MRRVRWINDKHGQCLITCIDSEDELPDRQKAEIEP